MNVVTRKCFKCGRSLDFRSLQEFPSYDIGDPEIPSMLNFSLNGNIIICGECKSYNEYVYTPEGNISEIKELNYKELNEIRR